MTRRFPNLTVVLLVGVGGGIADLIQGIGLRLGDVVVGQPKEK